MFYWSFWGMHLFWWLFWALMIVLFFSMLTPVPRSRARLYDDPEAILRRRFALGELSTEEFEQRRAVLRRTAIDRVAERPPEPGAPAGATPAPSAT